jgi:hypothetical protein
MRADPFIRNNLPDLLIEDWYNLSIYNEFDLQVAAYYWLRREFDRLRSQHWIIRAQPRLEVGNAIMKPDIVIYKMSVPYDVIELKCQMVALRESPLRKDLDKLKALKKLNVRHAYLLVLYDDDGWYDKFTRREISRREDWMKNYLTPVFANVRCHAKGRKRRGYDEVRARWERFEKSKRVRREYVG